MSTDSRSSYDVTVIGGGHNGLVAACYLAKAGLSVLILERNGSIGGATRSARSFAPYDANLSVYSYLVSLFPEKIVNDLGLELELRRRKTASWSPTRADETARELLIRNDAPTHNREAFVELAGDERDYTGYLALQEMQRKLAEVIWPSLTEPLVTRKEMRSRCGRDGAQAWQALIEEPLGITIERLISHDLIRGLLVTDGKIGVSTHPHDPALLQNRSFLYHVIGRGSGEWRVPVGGMGGLVNELVRVAKDTGKVTILTGATVTSVCPQRDRASVGFEIDGAGCEADASYVLCNASADVLDRLTGAQSSATDNLLEGAGFKINMLLARLPQLRASRYSAAEAFAGTVHIDEGYEQMRESYETSSAGLLPATPPGEIYCHTLTDDSILSPDLQRRGYHTLTLFGLDLPYRLFTADNARVREEVLEKYLAGINRHLAEPIEDCLARDADGNPCIEAKSPVDLEREIHLPKGNIFHGDLTWPFTDSAEDAGQWGVETGLANIFFCGSGAMRGGAVSGIPGHNAAMKVLESEGRKIF